MMWQTALLFLFSALGLLCLVIIIWCEHRSQKRLYWIEPKKLDPAAKTGQFSAPRDYKDRWL